MEVQLFTGGLGFSIVGLPAASVKKLEDEVMADFYAKDCCTIPDKRIQIDLSPVVKRKGNSRFLDIR
ncbi:magnesium chelatase domain-containing protein [Radiobacillus sp. PE A8.2]|uniref:magnesium chelatase domain-containing protein n=1 Tax=Radiobacillus sp. PE A8.2 TaxID=3380349 RepID=UPI00388DA5A7